MTYRGVGEIDTLKADRDCIKMFRQRVNEAGLLEAEQLDAIDREARQLVDEALAEAKAGPAPTEADLLTDVYASY
jgi:pyruvate dehydrogenase E1 component alpha subunit